jgi:hypothetical protein
MDKVQKHDSFNTLSQGYIVFLVAGVLSLRGIFISRRQHGPTGVGAVTHKR